MSDRSVALIEHSPTHAFVRIDNTSLRFDFTLKESALQPLFSDPCYVSSRFVTCMQSTPSRTSNRFQMSRGMMLWPASVELSCYLKDEVNLIGKSVLELGAGLGLCGMVAALCGASKSVITERKPELEYLQASALRNQAALSGRGVVVHELDWSNGETVARLERAHGQVDVVLAADCISTDVYGAESRDALLRCLKRLVKGNAEVLLCSSKREGDGLERFVSRVEEMEAFRAIEVVKEGVNADGDFVIYKISK